MTTAITRKVVPGLLAALFSGHAAAAGFQLLEQNGSGIGNAYAGSAAVADNASTIFFNPAGMTRLQAREASFGGTVVQTRFDFRNAGSTNPSAFGGGAATGNDGDGGTLGVVPSGYLAWSLSPDLYVGVGLGAPFGLKTEYDDNWKGRYHSQSFDIKTYNINPSIAYRASERVSLGFGVNLQRFDAEYIRQAHPALGKVVLSADDTAWGWNAGALFTLSPATRVGVSYRSRIEYTLEGSLATAVPGGSGPACAKLETPDMFFLSVAQTLSDRWEMLGDISWTGWSSIKQIDIVRSDLGATVQSLHPAFKNSWRVAFGANYRYNEAMTLKFGVARDQTPVPDAEHRLTSLPDNDRTWLSFGMQYKPNKMSALDVGIAHLFVGDTSINNADGATRGLVNGTYDSSAWLLGAQYSLSF